MPVTKKLISTYIETGDGANEIVAALLTDAMRMHLDGKDEQEIQGATGVAVSGGSIGVNFSAQDVMAKLNGIHPAEDRLQRAAQGLPDSIRRHVVGHKVELVDRPGTKE